jgi:pyruvate ferredoxin oxidoreductase alpha subunit
MYAEDVQEACDMHVQAFAIAEELNIPVMVCMDGYILTHAMEPVELLEQDQVDAYLPPFAPKFYLTPKDPITLGSMAGPDAYMEIRLLLHQSMQRASFAIREEANRFSEAFGRPCGDLLDSYRAEDAELLLVSLGSLIGTMKDTVDDLRDEGHPVGIVKVRTLRPFPRTQLHDALADAKVVGVIEKDVSLGLEGILCSEIRSAFCGAARTPNISSFVVGLGGRDVTVDNIKSIALGLLSDDTCRVEMAGIDHEVLWSAHSEEE